MADRWEAARGSISSARSAVAARGIDTEGVESAIEPSPGESGDAVPRESAPCCEVAAAEGVQAPVFDFDILSPACPSRTVLRHVVDRWTPLVVMVLADGPSRFGELRARVGGVTPKVLTQRWPGDAHPAAGRAATGRLRADRPGPKPPGPHRRAAHLDPRPLSPDPGSPRVLRRRRILTPRRARDVSTLVSAAVSAAGDR